VTRRVDPQTWPHCLVRECSECKRLILLSTSPGIRIESNLCLASALPTFFLHRFTGGTKVPTAALSFLNRRTVNKQVCRICHGLAELKTERLCADCIRIKAQLRSRFSDAARVMSSSHEQLCKRAGCVCSACDGRTLDAHPSYPSTSTGRELHFHPRCHDLWSEISGGGSEHGAGK